MTVTVRWSTALNSAYLFLRAGEGEIALAVGAEKMYSTDKERMFSIFNSGWDIHNVEETKMHLLELGDDLEIPPNTTSDAPYSVFMDVYASFGRFHMREFGTTQEQIAMVAVKNHQNSIYNPLAEYQRAYSIEEVLNARPITYPLTLPMCAPISDGAAAVILCTESALKRFNQERSIEVLATVIQSGSNRKPEEVDKHVSALGAKKAYEKAGIGPEDISVAEVHDATAIGEIIQVENLGLCNFGEGGYLAEKGELNLDGRIPVNPSEVWNQKVIQLERQGLHKFMN